jgi:impB/mucB/samB family protein
MCAAPSAGRSPTSAALDLGVCTEQEALTLSRHLADRLRWDEVSLRIGIGPTLPVAQLALLTCPASQQIALVSGAALPAFLTPLPIAALCALDLPIPIPQEAALRLRRAGIRTLGQLARLDDLDDLALRRQFGAVGILLATLAHGEAPTPFHSTPPEPTMRFRTRFTTTLSMEQTLSRLPGLASEIATRLQALKWTTGALALTVCWASGGVERVEHTLPEPTQAASVLAQRLTSLLTSLLSSLAHPQSSEIERLDVRVSSLAPVRPQQRALWATPQHVRSERRRRIAALAEQLAQLYRRPALLTIRPTHKATTCSEERYTLERSTLATFTTRADPPRPPAPSRAHEPRQGAQVRPHWW